MASRPKVSERLLLIVDLVVANGVAAIWVATFLQPDVLGMRVPAANGAIERAARVPLDTPLAWLTFAGAAALLLWNFSWLVRRREKQPPSNWILSDTGSGPVRVAREAIETGLRLAGEALPEITRVRVQVDNRTPKRILVVGQFYCAEGQNHLYASQRLRQAMRDRFAELVRLGDGTRAEFEFEFQGFLGKLDKRAGEVPPVEDAPPFTGPQYPIDDDHNL